MLQTAMEEISSLKRSVESMGLSIHNASATGKAALKGTWDELTGRLLSLGWSTVGPGGFTGAVTFAEAPVGEAVGTQLDLEALVN